MAYASESPPGSCARCGAAPATVMASTREGPRRELCTACGDRLVPGIQMASSALSLIPDRATPDQCPSCGQTRDELLRTGLAGCALCYVVFEQTIYEMLAR